MKRRDLLKGAAVITVPALIHGCAGAVPVPRAAPGPERPYLDEFSIDESALDRAVSALGANGADFGEIYFQHRVGTTIRFANGEPDDPVRDERRGAGLRAVRDGRLGFAVTDDLSDASLFATARAAADYPTVRIDAPAKARRFLPPGLAYPTDTAWREVADSRRVELLGEVDRRIHGADPTVAEAELVLADVDEWILIATLDGRLVADRRPMTRLSVQVTLRRAAESHTGFAAIAGRQGIDWYDAARIGRLVDRALENTAILFEARRPPAGEMPVVLAAGSSGVLMHEVLGHGFEADFVAEGRSRYASSPSGLLSPLLTIIDDATIPGLRGALNVDDEGTAGQRTVIVENGRLRSLLHDRSSAARAGVVSTGNGRRESYRVEPMPRMTTTLVEGGPHAPEALIDGINRGVLAATYTGGRVDPDSGDFRFRVRHGWYIERGRKRIPLRDFELVGNGPALLNGISMVANDARMDTAGWTCGKKDQAVPVSHGLPSILVGALGVVPLS